MFWRILLAILVCPLSLLVIWHRKFWTFFWIILLTQYGIFFLLFLHACFLGEGMRLFYTYNKDEIRVIEDKDFFFYKEGYTASYKLNSKYYVSHRILLIPESKSVPVQHKFDGEMLIEIYDKNHQLLHFFKANKPINLLREGEDDYFDDYLVYIGKNTSHATSVFAFELGEIPFSLIRLKWSRLKNMEIKITVLKPEKGLLKFCDKATLVIIPDLRL
jgi:hypothetical protein